MVRSKKNPKKSKTPSPPKQATKIAKDRRHRIATTIRAVGHVTAEQFMERHKFCIRIEEIYSLMNRDPEAGVIISEDPRAHKAVCDHPEDGYCGTSISPETLQKVNDRLGHRVPQPQEEINELVKGEEYVEEAVGPIVRTVGEFTFTLGGKNGTRQ